MASHTSSAILVIDDDPGMRRALVQLLRRDGYAVATAATSAEALAQLATQRFEGIVCALPLAGLDGPAFAAVLHQQYPTLWQRVVFLTSDLWQTESLAFLIQCGQPWLPKPCRAAALRVIFHKKCDCVDGISTTYPPCLDHSKCDCYHSFRDWVDFYPI